MSPDSLGSAETTPETSPVDRSLLALAVDRAGEGPVLHTASDGQVQYGALTLLLKGVVPILGQGVCDVRLLPVQKEDRPAVPVLQAD